MPLDSPVVITSVVLGGLAGLAVPPIAYRWSVEYGEPRRTACSACDTPLPRGWAVAAIRCPHCRTVYRGGHWWTAPTGALAAGAVALAADSPWVLAAGLVVSVLGILLAAIDLAVLRLPDPLVAATGVGCAAMLCVAAATGAAWTALGVAALTAAAALVCFFVLAVISNGQVGLGDVKLAGVLGLLMGWWGWAVALVGFLVALLINGVFALFMLVMRRAGWRSALPMGPALLAGTFATLALVGLLR